MKILYKFLVPLLCVAVIALGVFAPLFHISITSALAGDLNQTTGLPEYSSVMDFAKMSKNMDETRGTILKSLLTAITDPTSSIGAKLTNIKYLKAAGVVALVMVVFLLATAVVAAATKQYWLTVVLSALSLITGVVSSKLFDAFAKPFLTGKISLSSLLGNSGGDLTSGLLGSLMNNVVKVEALELAWAWQAMSLLMVAILLFTGGWFIKKRFME